jgi:hypothetical protein
MLQLWVIRAGRLFKEFSNHEGPVTAVEYHPAEYLLASGIVIVGGAVLSP